MDTYRKSQPVRSHGDCGNQPTLGYAICQVRHCEQADTEQVNIFRANSINEPADERGGYTGEDHTDAIHEA